MARHDRKGRNKTSFVKLDKYILKSDVWKELSPSAVKVFIELQRRYHGGNNGRIIMSVTEAAQYTGLSRTTVQKTIGELINKGFVKCHFKGAYRLKFRHASEYEITDKQIKDGSPPSREFMKWKAPEKKKPVTKSGSYSIKSAQVISFNKKMDARD